MGPAARSHRPDQGRALRGGPHVPGRGPGTDRRPRPHGGLPRRGPGRGGHRRDARLRRGTTGELASLDAILLRSESASSSQIENLTASARAVAEAEVTHAGRGNAAVVVANAEAMVAAIELADRLDADAILRMQDVLLRQTSPPSSDGGTEPVWIGPGGSTPADRGLRRTPSLAHPARPSTTSSPSAHGTTSPCSHRRLSRMPSSRRSTRSPTATAAPAARSCTPCSGPRASRATSRSPSPGGCSTTATATWRPSRPTARVTLEPIVTAFALEGLRAVHHGRVMRERIASVRTEWHERVGARRDSAVWRLADLLIAHPVVDAAAAARELGISETNVHRHLQSWPRQACSSRRTTTRRAARSGVRPTCSRCSTRTPATWDDGGADATCAPGELSGMTAMSLCRSAHSRVCARSCGSGLPVARV